MDIDLNELKELDGWIDDADFEEMNNPTQNMNHSKTIYLSNSSGQGNQSKNYLLNIFTQLKKHTFQGFHDIKAIPNAFSNFFNTFWIKKSRYVGQMSASKMALSAIISCYIIFYVGIRAKYPFWMKQPVLHHHDLLLRIKAPCVISTDLPPSNRYVNNKIRFRKFNDLSMYDRDHFFDLISKHYLRGGKEEYRPSEDSIFRYFQNLNLPSFFSLYYDNVDIRGDDGELAPEQRRLIGAMTTRPLHLYLKNEKSSAFDSPYPLYYVDWLCVHSAHRKQGKAAEIIYTHFFNQQRQWGKSSIYLFKREGKNTPIVPLTKYMTYGFDIEQSIREYNTEDIPKEHILVKRMLSGEINLVKNIMENIRNDFQCVIFPGDVLLKNMMKNSLIYVFAVYINQTPIGCVFCRNSQTHIDVNDGKTKEQTSSSENNTLCVEIFASYFPGEISRENIMLCFDHISDMMKTKLKVRYIILENISHNTFFIEGCLSRLSPLFRTPHNYYLYNFAQKSLLPKNVFIIN